MTDRIRAPLVLAWLLGATAVVAAATHVDAALLAAPADAIGFTLLAVLAILGDMKPMPYSFGREGKETSLTITILLGTLFIFGWPAAVLMAVISAMVSDIFSGKPYYKTLFNAGLYSSATLAAGLVYGWLEPAVALQSLPPTLTHLVAGYAAGLVFAAVNVTLLMWIIARAQGGRTWQLIAWDLRDSALVTVTLISIAVGGSLVWQWNPIAAIVLLPPVYMAKVGYEGYLRLRIETEAVLASLADLLDLRDHNTGQHSLRVSELASALALRLGLSEEQALAIRAIARVHDVGKIVIRDAVLLKPGTLSPEEIFEMQNHVEAGGQILSHLSVYKPYLSILLQHHERLDGLGYPQGLHDERIDIGAKIIAVCDAYDTMTSDRPYRAACPSEAAMAELYRKAGSQFDPAVVEAFETWLLSERRLRADWRAAVEPEHAAAPDHGDGDRRRPTPARAR